MKAILAAGLCPGWCDGHVPCDGDAVLHISTELSTYRTAGGFSDNGAALVSAERRDGDDALVRVEGADGAWTPAEAFRFALQLQVAAFAATTGQAVTR